MATSKKIAKPSTPAAPAAELPTQAPVAAPVPASKPASAKKPAAAKQATKKLPKPEKAAAPAKAAEPEKAAAPEKAKKPKLVRDSFTIPKAEYVVLDELKQRATLLTRPVKKSELLRASIKLLAALPDAQFLAALAEVPTIKTGRPVLEK